MDLDRLESDLAPYWEESERILVTDLGGLCDADLAVSAQRLGASLRTIDSFGNAGEGGDEIESVRLVGADVFSLVREAARRTIGLDPHPVQVVAGLAMARGRVAELPTGEGKTLAAVFAATLHGLAGRGVHVLTFNDYLARRDAAWMGPVYRMLGLSVGCIQEGMAAAERRAAYRCDVTYLTAKEAGFDLLRDGVCLEPEHQVHRPLHLALVDEADSILVDEARIPLVIAGAAEDAPDGLAHIADLAHRLSPGADFDIDPGERNIFLTEGGIVRVERELACDLFAGDGVVSQAALRNALHAEHLLRRDVDYIVRHGCVELVDELTGRVAENRHWPDGLQAAVEAKEGLRVGSGGTILGSITLQHLLRRYPLICGMTATAVSAADELWDVYGLRVVAVPPNRPCIRVDEADLVFAGRDARDRALVAEIARVHRTARPVLVGTASVEESDHLAAMLQREGVECDVLNARNDEREAAVVAEAGDLGRVTISTNMAGRGTDIRLGGLGERNRDRVLALGGLYVIGTNRHESLRIDLQLRGRAGRQGDPGSTRFFISLEDPLVRRAGIDRLVPREHELQAIDGALDSRFVQRAIEHAQRVAEGECFDARKRIYEYAEVIERQQHQIQDRRQALLERRLVPALLESRCHERWSRLIPMAGESVLQTIERRLTLSVIDRCWAEHLDELRMLRDEIHLVALDGRTPVVEFTRAAIAAFERLPDRIDDAVVELFDAMEITGDGVDWEAHGLRGPSATWTYLISDTAFAANPLRTLANHASIGLFAVLLWSPLLFGWGLYLHWRRRRARARGTAEAELSDPGE